HPLSLHDALPIWFLPSIVTSRQGTAHGPSTIATATPSSLPIGPAIAVASSEPWTARCSTASPSARAVVATASAIRIGACLMARSLRTRGDRSHAITCSLVVREPLDEPPGLGLAI